MNESNNNIIRVLVITTLTLIATAATGCKEGATSVQAVKSLDLERYMGRWYEIARLPHRFERDLICVTAEYSLLPDGRVKVVNAGVKLGSDGRPRSAEAVAWRPDPAEPARLKVRFFWPFSAPYIVIALDREYRYAMVTSSSTKYLWILSREPSLSRDIYDGLVRQAAELGFPVGDLIEVPHTCSE